MFFIFGWGRARLNDRGEAYPLQCPNCNNKVFFRLTTISKWFSLFFIPIIPYDTKHYLSCPVCSKGRQLTGEQEKRAEEMISITRGFLEKTVDPEEYKQKLDEYGKHLFEQPKLT